MTVCEQILKLPPNAILLNVKKAKINPRTMNKSPRKFQGIETSKAPRDLLNDF